MYTWVDLEFDKLWSGERLCLSNKHQWKITKLIIQPHIHYETLFQFNNRITCYRNGRRNWKQEKTSREFNVDHALLRIQQYRQPRELTVNDLWYYIISRFIILIISSMWTRRACILTVHPIALYRVAKKDVTHLKLLEQRKKLIFWIIFLTRHTLEYTFLLRTCSFYKH